MLGTEVVVLRVLSFILPIALWLMKVTMSNKLEGARKERRRMGKNQHVVPSNGRWGIKGEGNSRMTGYYDTQREAAAAARQIAINQQSELFIHRPNGQIRERNSYGNDPFPPRG